MVIERLSRFMEAPWSSGERGLLTIRAIVLGRGFEPQLHLKTRWKKTNHSMAEKLTKIIKTAKWGKSHQKKKI